MHNEVTSILTNKIGERIALDDLLHQNVALFPVQPSRPSENVVDGTLQVIRDLHQRRGGEVVGLVQGIHAKTASPCNTFEGLPLFLWRVLSLVPAIRFC